jgi:Amiloride-sensitive sodium channel
MFLFSTVVTTIHSTTVPLSEVFFPAVTVCNINQVQNQQRQPHKKPTASVRYKNDSVNQIQNQQRQPGTTNSTNQVQNQQCQPGNTNNIN